MFLPSLGKGGVFIMGEEMLEQFKPPERRLTEKIGAGIEDIRADLCNIAQKGLDSGLVERVREGAYGVVGEVRSSLERFHPKRVQAILTESLSQKGKVPGELAGRVAEAVVDLVSPENEGKPIGKEEERKFLSILERIGGKRLKTAVVSLITSERGSVSLGGEESPQEGEAHEGEEERLVPFGAPSVPKEYKAIPWWQRPMTRRTVLTVGGVLVVGVVGAEVKPVREFAVGAVVGLIKKIFTEAPRAVGEKVKEEEIKKEPGGGVKLMAQDIGKDLGDPEWGTRWTERRTKYQEMFDASRGKEEMPLRQFVVDTLQHNMKGEYKWFRVDVSAMYEVMTGYGSLEEISNMLGENKYSPEEIEEWEKFYQAASQTNVKEKESFQPVIDWVNEWIRTPPSSTP